jgi:hypothetical protein
MKICRRTGDHEGLRPCKKVLENKNKTKHKTKQKQNNTQNKTQHKTQNTITYY